MTIPYERTKSLVLTKELLRHLASCSDGTVPSAVVREAQALLPHYPTLQDIEIAHKSNPEIYGPAPPFQRIAPNPQVLGVLNAAEAGDFETGKREQPDVRKED